MELIGSIFLILAVAVAAALFVGRPLILYAGSRHDRSREEDAVENALSASIDHRRSALLAERDRVLNALQELDFDYSMGKVPEDEYPVQRTALLRTGAAALRQLDVLQGSGGDAIDVAAAEEQLEAAAAVRQVARGRKESAHLDPSVPTSQPVQSLPVNSGGTGRDPLEDMIAARKRERQEKSAGFCPNCGRPVQKSDKFCARCGATL